MAGIKIDIDKCKGCGLCVIYCPKGLITLDGGLNKTGMKTARFFNEDKSCTACTFCALICPDCAIEVDR